GRLSHLDVSGLRAGARVDVDDYGKDDPRDFVLWKARKPGEQAWETALGAGRPGWHIECSAMSMEYLGESFDIHTGGVDNIFPHHENEIAQSESATGKTFARYWLHAQHLQDAVGEKMSKRLKNFSTLRDLLAEGYQPRAIRYALMTGAHYRSPLAFSPELLKAVDSAIKRLDEFAVRLGPVAIDAKPPSEILQRWDGALRDDLNLPAAVGHLFDFIKTFNTRLEAGQATPDERAAAMAMLRHANRILDVIEFPGAVDAEVERLIAEREEARERRGFDRADQTQQQVRRDVMLLMLDSLQDPQTLGTISRTAEATGVGGIVTSHNRSPEVTPSVVKASAGAAEHLRYARVSNLAQASDTLKDLGFWIVGLSGDAPTLYTDFDYRRPLVLVVGAEGEGLHELLRKKSDAL